jgi:hypothetical protein
MAICAITGIEAWMRDHHMRPAFDILHGLRTKIPPCCILEFTIRNFLGGSPAYDCGCAQFGAYSTHDDSVCCWIHRKLLHPHIEALPLDWHRDGRGIIKGWHFGSIRQTNEKYTAICFPVSCREAILGTFATSDEAKAAVQRWLNVEIRRDAEQLDIKSRPVPSPPCPDCAKR